LYKTLNFFFSTRPVKCGFYICYSYIGYLSLTVAGDELATGTLELVSATPTVVGAHIGFYDDGSGSGNPLAGGSGWVAAGSRLSVDLGPTVLVRDGIEDADDEIEIELVFRRAITPEADTSYVGTYVIVGWLAVAVGCCGCGRWWLGCLAVGCLVAWLRGCWLSLLLVAWSLALAQLVPPSPFSPRSSFSHF
jgi:hypothetical protein